MPSNSSTVRAIRTLLFVGAFGIAQGVQASIIAVTNAGFEDTTGLNAINEFHFGQPAGWTTYDPNSIIGNATGSNGIFLGTLHPNGTDFFNTTAPEGDEVAILFGFSGTASAGAGEYGIEQTLGDSLQANTLYELSVEVGNIGSGTGVNNQVFDLSGFPGYRVDLLAGGVVIASDNNSLTIPELEFSTSTVSFSTDAGHALLGQSLGIRLVNLNTQQALEDIEVDFDDVQLEATSVPEPSAIILFGAGILGLIVHSRRRKQKLG